MQSDVNPFESPLATASSPEAFPKQGDPSNSRAVFDSASGRARLSIIAFWVFILLLVVSAASSMAEYSLLTRIENGEAITQAQGESNDLRQRAIGISELIFLLCNVVLYCRWVYRAHANLPSLSSGPFECTPGWSVGWYFVPFLNLVRPFQATKELWQGSAGEVPSPKRGGSALLNLWWTAWILQNLTGNVAGRLISSAETIPAYKIADIANIVDALITIVAALLVIRVIRGVDRRQTSRAKELGYIKDSENDWAEWSQNASEPTP